MRINWLSMIAQAHGVDFGGERNQESP